ncbi:winged helix-turn-helix transcriptional regulator [Lactococcus termiticola]|nr:helix-turn-helix domain-containing protein [Lactococcus termiticola]
MKNEYISSATTHFEVCPLDTTIKILSGRWKSIIICRLMQENLHFNELSRRIPDCTRRMLALQLKELIEAGIVYKNKTSELTTFNIEYSLTDIGNSLLPVISEMNEWGSKYLLANEELTESE